MKKFRPFMFQQIILMLLILLVMTLYADTGQLKDQLALNFRQNDWPSGLKTANQLISAESSSGLHYFARGMVRYELHRFEEAKTDFDRASSLGVSDSKVHPEGGDPLGSFREWNSKAIQLMPLRETWPSRNNYMVALRYRNRGAYAQAAIVVLPKLEKLSKEVFGIAPEGAVLQIIDSGTDREIFDATKLNVSCSSPCMSAQVKNFLVTFYEGDPKMKKRTQRELEDIVVHEFGHLMHNYLKSRDPGKDDPRWWREGIAVLLEHRYRNYSKQDSIDIWNSELRLIKEQMTESQWFGSTFGGTKFERTNYAFSALMVRNLVERHGVSMISRVCDRMTGEADESFEKALKAVAGTDEKVLFRQILEESNRLADKNREYRGGVLSDSSAERGASSSDRYKYSVPAKGDTSPAGRPLDTPRYDSPPSPQTKKISEGSKVNCSAGSGVVVRTIGKRLLVKFDSGKQDVVEGNTCTPE